MTYAFHTPDKLCFILDLMNGEQSRDTLGDWLCCSILAGTLAAGAGNECLPED